MFSSGLSYGGLLNLMEKRTGRITYLPTTYRLFIVKTVIDVCSSKPMQCLDFEDFGVFFDFPDQDRLLNVLSAKALPEMFVRLIDDMNRRGTAAVGAPACCVSSSK
ncbi:hypothetical protein RB195_017108 [Necator americanus]|uniref:Uncharacterized protein n=1 Tax=Necator americanus TaxID=51031 RepID=A0ABR1C3M5_NECAM